MRRDYQNRLRMWQTTYKVCFDNADVYNSAPVIVEIVADLKKKIDRATLLSASRKTVTQGISDDKKMARAELATAIDPILGALKSLAARTGDSILAAQVDYAPFQFATRLPEEDLLTISTVISDIASTKEGLLAGYGVTKAAIENFGSKLGTFKAKHTGPQVARTSRSSVVASLDTVMLEGANLLSEQLDKAMLVYKKTNPEFHAKYEAARVIIDNPARHQKAPGAPSAKRAVRRAQKLAENNATEKTLEAAPSSEEMGAAAPPQAQSGSIAPVARETNPGSENG